MAGRDGGGRGRGQMLHRLVPVKVSDVDRLPGLEVVPAEGVIPSQHEVAEVAGIPGLASPLGDVEGRLPDSLLSVLE